MDLGIAGKWALIGGGSKGLGFGCANALAREGVNVVMVARGKDALEQAAAKILADPKRPANTAVEFVAVDITTKEGRDQIFAKRKDWDIVVTNSGGPPRGDFREWEPDVWFKALNANMVTPIELIKATVDGMAARGFGRIVNITSSSVRSPIEALGLSNGARAGLTGFVAGISRLPRYVSNNVTINNLLPGAFLTDRLRGAITGEVQKAGKTFEQAMEERRTSSPAGRMGDPEEFGATCAFMCSQYAAYMTGQNVLLDGGVFRTTM